ncbi:MAG TPA: hypothetical protein DD706_07545 [Nitrospiraceae bacterium]|nr:hypothetical protein [Nitrospiraceae bacterium]
MRFRAYLEDMDHETFLSMNRPREMLRQAFEYGSPIEELQFIFLTSKEGLRYELRLMGLLPSADPLN